MRTLALAPSRPLQNTSTHHAVSSWLLDPGRYAVHTKAYYNGRIWKWTSQDLFCTEDRSRIAPGGPPFLRSIIVEMFGGNVALIVPLSFCFFFADAVVKVDLWSTYSNWATWQCQAFLCTLSFSRFAVWFLCTSLVLLLVQGSHRFWKSFGVWKINSRLWKSMDIGVWVWKGLGLLEIRCFERHIHNIVGWLWDILVLFSPVRSVSACEKGFAKVLEKFWNFISSNLCKPCW